MGMNDRQLRRYLRQIRSMLPCGGKRRRELMDNVRSGATRYLEEHPDATAEQVMAYFGAPEAIAASYVESAGTAEILRAVRTLADRAARGEIAPTDITAADFEAALYTHDLPDVDLLIRTSGEMRLSNFLLYQCAYAEMTFPTVLWPDFSLDDYHSALAAFGRRDRRFGGRNE